METIRYERRSWLQAEERYLMPHSTFENADWDCDQVAVSLPRGDVG